MTTWFLHTIILISVYDVRVLACKPNRTQSHILDSYYSGTTKIETHLKGVERIVAVRGGLDKLGYNGVQSLGVMVGDR